MKKLIAGIAAVALAFAAHAASPAATQAWVMKYCADHGLTRTQTATGATYTHGEGTNTVSMSFVRPTSLTLFAADCDSASVQDGVTNGMRFAYHAPYAVFVNQPAQKRIWIDVDPSTLARRYVYNSWTSTVYGAHIWLTDSGTNRHFRVMATRIMDDEAHSLTNGFNGGAQ